jgi:Transposase IS116/IS110/IS902 family
VLERYADPRALLRLGAARLTALIARASRGHQGAERARQWPAAARAAVDLYRGHPAADFTGLAAEVATEVRLLPATCAELAAHAAEREARYQQAAPSALARSLPGLADIGGPALTACMGDPARFAAGKRFRSFTGLTPKASETGETDRKGQPMSKAGSSLLRTTLVRAADTARRQDPQLAAIYYLQMTERGKDHPGALCVVAACLAERAWTVMRRRTPTSSATPTASPSPHTRPTRSSPDAGPCRLKSAPAGAARRRGRPPRKSSKDNTHGAASPAPPPHRPAEGPSSRSLDKPSSIGNQIRWIRAGVQCTAIGYGWPAPKPAWRAGGEATGKACGVTVAMLPGQSWMPS